MLLCHVASSLREGEDVPESTELRRGGEIYKEMEGELGRRKSPTVGGDEERERY